MTDTSSRRQLGCTIEQWPFAVPFRITGHTWTMLDMVVVTIAEGGYVGRGEGEGVYYRDDTPPGMARQIEAARGAIEAGAGREEIARILPPGGARNAVDCALWDLEAKLAGQPAWRLAGLQPPRPLVTTYTIGADPPAIAAERAVSERFAAARAIKLKLVGEPEDAERVKAVRAARPDVGLTVDANQGYGSRTALEALAQILVDAKVELVEQPFPVGQEALLDGLDFPIDIAADESVQVAADIAALAGRVDMINIKLDKCGGLTEALAMLAEIERLGLKAMVGNMFGTSLAMGPAFLVGQSCQVVDLDGPIGLADDRPPAVSYDGGRIWCAPEAWGGGA
ncbi:MAG TPA: dipeptide epimerase [Caulobacteraceae bacterium]|jgi:L-alanine-DL-glutamate epimerase-like enolase superfamily enzyme